MSQKVLKPDFLLNSRYRICNCLGQGGFGITYRALDEKSGQTVAVKEYFPGAIASREETGTVLPSQDNPDKAMYRKGLERFLQEARTLASLFEVPGVVKVLNYFEANQTAYIVMEYVHGISLRIWLERQEREFSFNETCQMFRPVMDALESIHKKHLIHRDITPDNIMVDETGNLRLLDFGSTREYFAEQDRERTMTVLVKYAYAPPEQYDRHGKQGPWTDIYSLCATMYELMTGCIPQSAKEREVDDRLYPVSSFGCEIAPQQEEHFMKKGLALNFKERYQSVRKMREDFFAEITPEPDTRVSHKRLAVAVLLSILLVATGTLVYFLNRTENELPALAGNYVRGSSEYNEFLSFIKERAISSEPDGDVTTYTLDEQAVRDWEQSSNAYTIGYTCDQLIGGLQELGYTPSLQKTEDEFTVREEPYGVLVTHFDRRAFYTLTEEIELQIAYDLLSQEITYIYVTTAPEKIYAAAPYFVDVFSILAEDMDGTREEWLKNVSETVNSWYPDKVDSLFGFDFQNISVYFTLSPDETRAGIRIISAESDSMRSGRPYYWP